MIAPVIDLVAIIEARETKRWDALARAAGFKDYAALEQAYEAEFDRRYQWLEDHCTHTDKHPDLLMCEQCADCLQL